MREIKFRVWDGFRYIYFDNHRYDLIYNDISGWNVCPNVPNYKGKWTTGESSDTAESFKMEQFTGLKDNNGKGIWEGDICKVANNENASHLQTVNCNYAKRLVKDDVLIIKWLPSGFTGQILSNQGDIPNLIGNVSNYSLWNGARQLIIIGNIHESPELVNQLKEETK